MRKKREGPFKIVCHWGTKSTAFTLCGNVCDINGGSMAFSLWWFISKMATIDSFPFHMLLSYREMNLLLPSPGSWTIFLTVWVRYHLRITSQEHHSWEVQDAWRGPEAACGGAQEAMRHQILRWRITIGVSSPSCPTITPWGEEMNNPAKHFSQNLEENTLACLHHMENKFESYFCKVIHVVKWFLCKNKEKLWVRVRGWLNWALTVKKSELLLSQQ